MKAADPPSRKPLRFLFGMSTLFLGANLVWISYNSVLLPALTDSLFPQHRSLVVGAIGFVGMILAVVANIWAGIVTDHHAGRWGKRIPGIVLGGLLSLPIIGLPSLLLLPGWRDTFAALALPILAASYCGMQFTTNISAGATAPLLAEMLPEKQRGTAAGIEGFYALTGAALGFIVVTYLNQLGRTDAALWFIGGIFLLTALFNAAAVRREDRPARNGKVNVWAAARRMFRVRTFVAVFFWMVLGIFLAYVGINSLQLFGRFALQVYFPQLDPDVALRTLGAVNLALTMLSAVASGLLSDRFGRRRLLLAGMLLSSVSSLLMGAAADFYSFIVLAGIRSLATGPLVAIGHALASDLAPKEEAGRYLAYYNLSTALSGALSALIFGLVLVDLSRESFMWMFILSAVFYLAGGAVFSLKVPQAELDRRTS
jgi:MFS family permease